MCELRSQIEEAQKRVIEAGDYLKELLEEQRELATETNRIHNPTILQLPPELASSIFQYVVPSVPFGPESDWKHFREAMAATLVLCAVCKEWRQLVWSTPYLWTTVYVWLEPQHLSRNLEFIKSWLGRSGGMPLSICVYGGRDLIYRSSLVDSMIGALNQCSNRWKSLSLHVPDSLFSRFSGNPRSGSILQYLSLDPTERGNRRAKFRMKNAHPRPTHIILSSVRFNSVAVEWINVTCVEVSDLSLNDCFEILKHAPQLIQYTISYPSDPNPPLANDLIIHPSLRRLVFEFPVIEDVDLFFDHLNLPGLKYLALNMDDGWIPFTSLLSLFRRSALAMEELRITDTIFSDGEIIRLCQMLPSLHRLELLTHLDSEHPQGEFFELLATSAMAGNDQEGSASGPGHPVFLPNLQFLRYDVVVGRFLWSLVPPIFGDLSDLENPRRRPLRSLYIRYDPLPEDDDDQLPYCCIEREFIPSLLTLREAGLDLKIVCPEERYDLIDVSLEEAENEKSQKIQQMN